MSYYTNSFSGLDRGYGFASAVKTELDNVETAFTNYAADLDQVVRFDAEYPTLPSASERQGRIPLIGAGNTIDTSNLFDYKTDEFEAARLVMAHAVISPSTSDQAVEFAAFSAGPSVYFTHSTGTNPEQFTLAKGRYAGVYIGTTLAASTITSASLVLQEDGWSAVESISLGRLTSDEQPIMLPFSVAPAEDTTYRFLLDAAGENIGLSRGGCFILRVRTDP